MPAALPLIPQAAWQLPVTSSGGEDPMLPTAIVGWKLHEAPWNWHLGQPLAPPQPHNSPSLPTVMGIPSLLHWQWRQQCPYTGDPPAESIRHHHQPTIHLSSCTAVLFCFTAKGKGPTETKCFRASLHLEVNEVSWKQAGNENGTNHPYMGITAGLALGLFSALKKRAIRKWSLTGVLFYRSQVKGKIKG